MARPSAPRRPRLGCSYRHRWPGLGTGRHGLAGPSKAPPRRGITGSGRRQVEHQKRATIHHRQTGLAALKDLVGLRQHGQGRRQGGIRERSLGPERRQRLADVAHRTRRVKQQRTAQLNAAHGAALGCQDGNRPLEERRIDRQRRDSRPRPRRLRRQRRQERRPTTAAQLIQPRAGDLVRRGQRRDAAPAARCARPHFQRQLQPS